jgi:hypothetical protein
VTAVLTSDCIVSWDEPILPHFVHYVNFSAIWLIQALIRPHRLGMPAKRRGPNRRGRGAMQRPNVCFRVLFFPDSNIVEVGGVGEQGSYSRGCQGAVVRTLN